MGVEGIDGQKSQGCHFKGTCAKDESPKETDNNNLLWVARVLELLYTEATPPFSPDKKHKLTKSLQEAGKSRADLWSFAGLVAIELSGQYHNNFCSLEEGGGCTDCPLTNKDGTCQTCAYKMPTLNFKTGRQDCIPTCSGDDGYYDFCSTATEEHPDPHGNGKSVSDFFNQNFNLNPRESIALLGAHALGHPNEQISGFRHYPWTIKGKEILNNEYYVQMVSATNFRRYGYSYKKASQCQDSYSSYVGDEFGNPFVTDWVSRSQWQNNDGGPWNWALFGGVCNEKLCNDLPAESKNRFSCCHKLVSAKCNKNSKDTFCQRLYCDPSTDNCNEKRFMSVSYMNIDMGLYFKFSSLPSGRPSGCSGLQRNSWLSNDKKSNQKEVKKTVENGRNSDVPHGCLLNDDDADGTLTMHEVVEIYAESNQAFINDFTAAFEKMMDNGYGDSGLNLAPSGWMGLKRKGSRWFNS